MTIIPSTCLSQVPYSPGGQLPSPRGGQKYMVKGEKNLDIFLHNVVLASWGLWEQIAFLYRKTLWAKFWPHGNQWKNSP